MPKMLIPFTERSTSSGWYVNPKNNLCHSLLPIISGKHIGLDNTCEGVLSTQAYFNRCTKARKKKEKQAIALEEFIEDKKRLELDISLIQEETLVKKEKQERLSQLNEYIRAQEGLASNKTLDSLNGEHPVYPEPLQALMRIEDANLYSIRLRPKVPDINYRTVNPLFSIKGGTDATGTLLSSFYNELWEAFEHLTIEPQDTRARLIHAVLNSEEAKNQDVVGIQRVLNQQAQRLLGVDIDFYHFEETAAKYGATNKELAAIWAAEKTRSEKIQEISLTAIDRILSTKLPEERYQHYQEIIASNPNPVVTEGFIQAQMRFDEQASMDEYIEALLGLCAPHVFDTLVESPFYAIKGTDKKDAIDKLSIATQFFMANANVYCVARNLSLNRVDFGKILDESEDLSKEIAGRIFSEYPLGLNIEDVILDFINDHYSEFQLKAPLTSEDRKNITTRFTENYAEIKDSPHFDEFILFDEHHPGLFVNHQNTMGVSFAEFAKSPLLNIDTPYFEKIREDYKEIAEAGILPHHNKHIEGKIEIDPQTLTEGQIEGLLTYLPLKDRLQLLKALPEYTARLQQRLQSDFLLHVARGEQSLAEKLLKNNPDVAQQLLTSAGTFTDYSGCTFNCTAYEYAYHVKDAHMCRMLQANMDEDTQAKISAKLDVMEAQGLVYQEPDAQGVMQTKQSQHFDITPLITALQDYVDGYPQWNRTNNIAAMKAAWMKVGQEQRRLPEHFVAEYCRNDRSFDLDEYKDDEEPRFHEKHLPRTHTFYNFVTHADESWFPLPSSSSGLGFDFAVIRDGAPDRAGGGPTTGYWHCGLDLTAIRRLDEVRLVDLTLLRENLSRPASQLGLVH